MAIDIVGVVCAECDTHFTLKTPYVVFKK